MKKNRFTYLQQEQILLGQAHDLPPEEIALYAKQRLNYKQMEQLREALEEHIDRRDVRRMAHAWIPAERMQVLREEMKLGDRNTVNETLYHGVQGRTAVCAFLSVCLFLFSGYRLVCRMLDQDPVFSLTCDETILSVLDEFVPDKYTVYEDAVLPERIRMRSGGEKLMVYSITYQGHRIDRTLLVHFQDDEPPVLVLSTEETDKEGFAGCRAYIEKAWDAVSGDLTQDVKCTEPLNGLVEQEIVYTVKDRAGNEAIAFLKVVQPESRAEREYWEAAAAG